MLAIFDSIFITTASVTFSLPLLSSYWQVQIHVKIQLLMKIQAKIQIQIQNNGHPGLGAPPPLPVAVAAHTNLSQRLNMVQFIFCLFLQHFRYGSCYLCPFLVLYFLMHLFHVAVACFINKIAHHVLFLVNATSKCVLFWPFEYQVDSVSHHREIYIRGPPKTLGNIFIFSILIFTSISIKSPLVDSGFQ